MMRVGLMVVVTAVDMQEVIPQLDMTPIVAAHSIISHF